MCPLVPIVPESKRGRRFAKQRLFGDKIYKEKNKTKQNTKVISNSQQRTAYCYLLNIQHADHFYFILFLFIYLFFIFFGFSRQGFLCVALAVLELTL